MGYRDILETVSPTPASFYILIIIAYGILIYKLQLLVHISHPRGVTHQATGGGTEKC